MADFVDRLWIEGDRLNEPNLNDQEQRIKTAFAGAADSDAVSAVADDVAAVSDAVDQKVDQATFDAFSSSVASSAALAAVATQAAAAVTAANGAVTAVESATTSVLQPIIERLGAGLSASELQLGDSMSNASDENAYLRAQRIAQAFPTATVQVRVFDIATASGATTSGSADITGVAVASGTLAVGQRVRGAGITAGTTIASIAGATVTLSAPATRTIAKTNLTASTGAYGAPEVLQPGDGSHTYTLWLWAMPGGTTLHALGVGSWAAKTTATAAQSVVIALGRNHGSGGAVPAHQWGTDLALLTEEVARALPSAAIRLVAQPPSGTDNDMAGRRLETLRVARTKGYAFVDVYSAFVRAAGGLANIATLLQADKIHPNAAGSQVWADEDWRSIRPRAQALPALATQRPSTLSTPPRNLLVNGDLSVRCGRIVLGSSTFTSGSTTVTVTSTTGLKVGAYVSGGNLPASTQIASITDSTHIVTTKAPTASATASLVQPQGFPYWESINLWDGTDPAVTIAAGRGSLPPGAGGMSPASAYVADLRQQATGAQGYLRQTVPVADIRGQELFAAMWFDRGEDDGQRMRIRLAQIGGTAVAGADLPSGQGGAFGGNWLGADRDAIPTGVPSGVRWLVSPDAASLEVQVYANAATSDDGARGGLDRVSLVAGPMPGDQRRPLAVAA